MESHILDVLADRVPELGPKPAAGGLYRHFKLTRDADGVAWLLFDRQGAGANTLSADVLTEFDTVLAALESERPTGLVIRSAKTSGFIAGADVNEFRGATDPAAVETQIARAHAVIDRLEAVKFPTVAVIHGFCLGGGLEVALACQMRIAIDGARFGFPEVMLGLHPGLGGTARFTELVNPTQAMTLMLTGRTIDARRAKSLGLVDAGLLRSDLGGKIGDACLALLDLRLRLIDLGNVVAIIKPFFDDETHHAQRQGCVSTGLNGDMPVSSAGSASSIGINHYEPGAITACFFDERPQVNVITVNVRRPRDDVSGVAEVFRVSAQFFPVDRNQGVGAGGCTDGAIETGGAEAMKKASIHGSIAQHPHVSCVGVREDGLWSVLFGYDLQPICDQVQCFVPADALEGFRFAAGGPSAFGCSGFPPHGIKQARGRVNAIQVLGDFGTEEAAGHGMRRIALHAGRLPQLVDGYENGAGVWAVMGTDSLDGSRGGHSSL